MKKKTKVYPLAEEEINISSLDKNIYGLSEGEKAFDFFLGQQAILNLKTMDNDAKSILVQNDIFTVADLKSASLDFLLNFNSDDLENRLSLFHECKRFLNSINFKNGMKFSDY